MVFACQRDSFQLTLNSTVKKCTKGTGDGSDFYEIVCEDSVLFPEGGGQPSDTGFLNEVPVHKVLRKGEEAVIYVKEPFEVGKEVTQAINWERRFDHMQQHSGQHLITAVINAEYKIDTTSWWLGEKVSHIELHTNQLTDEQISHIEALVNKKITEQIPVKVKLCEPGDEAITQARTRGLPEDVTWPIRIVEIVGLEDDLCCGTHVTNLSQLQCIKLLYAEKGKKNKTNLFFLAGNRVLQYLSECLNRELKLTQLLSSKPESHAELVEKLQQNLKSVNKKLKTALKEVAEWEVHKLIETKPQPKFYCHFSKEGDPDYLACFMRTLKKFDNAKDTFFVLAAGDEQGNGNLVILGKADDINVLAPRIAELLCGKGAANGNKFQAKVTKLTNFTKVENIVKEYFKDERSK